MKNYETKNQIIKVKRAFTLAEVLITLGIIGVVAAMTIPNVIANYQKTQYVTALKKAYATTNQALKQMAADEGCIDDLKCTGLFNTGTSDVSFGNVFIKYLNVAKNCKTNAGEHCWPDETNLYYDGTNIGTNPNYNTSGYYTFITTDGMSFAMRNFKNNCITDGTTGSTNWSAGSTGNMKQTCGYIRIDINGLKKPNILGRDSFAFFITNGKGAILYPDGGADDKYEGTDYRWKNSSGELKRCYPNDKWGSPCAGRVMEEGWQMNY